jgi:hypothetical protein
MTPRPAVLLARCLAALLVYAFGYGPGCARAADVAAPSGRTPTGADFIILANGFEAGDIELPFGSTNRTLTVQFSPTDPLADLVFSMDTTGSMGGEISNIQTSFASIAAFARALVPDTSFAAADWRDFPIVPFGNPADRPWFLRQAVTSNTVAAQVAFNAMAAAGGGDTPESGYEALYQLGAGTGVSWTGGLVPAYTGAGLGGVGFRAGSLRVVVHITDASSHTDTDYLASIPNAHSRSAAFTALAALGVRVIPVLSDLGNPDTPIANTQLQEVASVSGAEVAPCGLTHPPGCAVNQCCTGINGSGEPPNAVGRCPLRFKINSTGAGAPTVVNLGMQAVVKYGLHQLIAIASDDGLPGTLDTTCFIDRIEADAFIRPPQEPEASCVPEAIPVAIGGAGYNDGFANLATGSAGGSAGSALQFVARLGNACAPPMATTQVYSVNLDLMDTVTGAIMAHRVLTVVVPASP